MFRVDLTNAITKQRAKIVNYQVMLQEYFIKKYIIKAPYFLECFCLGCASDLSEKQADRRAISVMKISFPYEQPYFF